VTRAARLDGRKLAWLALAAAWLGFALRMVHLADVPPRWDEGWSVAHASLSLADLLAVTAADVHPPLYYLLLGAWQGVLGASLLAGRYASVLMSLPAVPLAFAAGRAWSGSRRIGLIAALLTAWLPLLVYYGAVVRMYALAPSFVLLAAWAGLRLAQGGMPGRPRVGWLTAAFVIGAAGAMLTLYHAAWALAALGASALLVALARRGPPPAWRRGLPLLRGITLAVIAYLPWAAYALPQLAGRAAAESAGNIAQAYPVVYFFENGLIGLTLSQEAGWAGVATIVLVVAVGMAARLLDKRAARGEALLALSLPLSAIGLTLLGVAAAARYWALNARMLIAAGPFLALLLAWAIDAAALRRRWLGIALAALLIAAYASTSAGLVYRKDLEVFDPYNPHTYRDNLADGGRPGDVAVFNVLSPAGFYLLDRQPADPAWSFALTWDPVIEPRPRWEQRITRLAGEHPRLWVVLYRGLAGRNGDLRGWLDSTYYPAAARWGEEEVFYGLYGTGNAALQPGAGAGSRWGDLELRAASLPARVTRGDVIPVALTWRALARLEADRSVFVHAVDDAGTVVAQHDAQPLNDLRPMTTLPPGEDVLDHHGLALPEGFTGRLRILVGIYDPASGSRLAAANGSDAIQIGEVEAR
jgi:hypothetical protein